MFCSDIDITNLEYKAPTSNRNGGKVVHVSTVKGSSDYQHRIRFQMSESDKENLQTAIWGLSTPLPGQDASRRTLELSIESPKLLSFLEQLDEKNVHTAIESTADWFRKAVDADAVRNMYVKLVKEPNKPGAKPSVRVKVKCGEYPTNIYVVNDMDAQGNLTYSKGTPEDLTKNVKCLVMVETVGLWFMSRQFGMSMSATEILVWPNRRETGIDAFKLSGSTKLHKSPIAPSVSVPAAPDGDVDMED